MDKGEAPPPPGSTGRLGVAGWNKQKVAGWTPSPRGQVPSDLRKSQTQTQNIYELGRRCPAHEPHEAEVVHREVHVVHVEGVANPRALLPGPFKSPTRDTPKKSNVE